MKTCECKHAWYQSLDESKFICGKCMVIKPKGDIDLLASLIDQVGHRESPECWCGPTLDYVDPDTGNEVWVHHKAS